MNLENIFKVRKLFTLSVDKHPKSDFCNWAIQDRLLCGPYPGKDGVNFTTDEEANENLQNILDDGITVFVNLCNEIPHQKYINNEYIEIVKRHPYFPDFDYYSKFLNSQQKDIIYEYFPYQDGCESANIVTILKQCIIIIDHLIQNRKVYIHCAGGHGRTGIFVNIIYTILFDYPIIEMFDFFQKVHDSRKKTDKKLGENKTCESPSAAQKRFVLKLGKYINIYKNLI